MKRSVIGLIYLIKGMKDAGLPVLKRLQDIGIDFDSLDPEATLHTETESQILAYIAEGVHPELGLSVGQHYALSGYGPLLMCLMTANTVQDALVTGVKYQQLTYLIGELQLKIEDRRVGLIYTPKNMQQEIGLFRAHAEISGTYKFLRDIYSMMGLSISKLTVELPFDVPKDPDYQNDFYHYYGRDLHFGASYAAFWSERHILDVGLAAADSITHQVYAKQCEQRISELQTTNEATRLVQTIEDYLMLQRAHIPSLNELAAMANLPERTIRHHLQQLNTSFKDIREQVLRKKALSFLASDQYSIESIAERLGYSETAGFNHAFKRWYGMSPKQYQKQYFSSHHDSQK